MGQPSSILGGRWLAEADHAKDEAKTVLKSQWMLLLSGSEGQHSKFSGDLHGAFQHDGPGGK